VSIRELADLREDSVSLCADLARIELAGAKGLRAPSDVMAIVRAHPLATSSDGLAQASEALASANSPGRSARLASLRDFLVRVRALAIEPRAAQEVWNFPLRPSVRLPGDPGLHGAVPPLAVERDLPFEPSRDRRAEMEDGLARSSEESAGALGAAWEASQAALVELKEGDPNDGAWALHERGWAEPAREPAPDPRPKDPRPKEPGLPAGLVPVQAPPTRDPLTEACEGFLQSTDAVAKDLGAWILRRHCGAQTRDLSRHDVLSLTYAPNFASAFPRGEMLRACRRWAEQLRLDLGGGGTVRLDDDDRPAKPLGARAVAVDPPHDVQVCLLPAVGPGALRDLLAALGHALLRAGPPPDAPPEDLWLGDRGLDHACEALFAFLLLDPKWTKRCAQADLSRDDERAIAVAHLFDARIAAARALASREAHESGFSARAASASRDLFQRACGAAFPAGLALRDLDPWLEPFAVLRGRAFAASAFRNLRERFDEDFWRNPRAGVAIQGLFARGGRPSLRELWAEIDGTPSLEPLAAFLLEACA
jgi:hypothetical protein